VALVRAALRASAIPAALAGCSLDQVAFTPAFENPGCAAEYCLTRTGCDVAYIDRIAWMSRSASKWFGGDDRPRFMRSIGTGQGVTPEAAVVMTRFGFHLDRGFTFSTTGMPGTQPNTLQLDLRNASGNVLASYVTTLSPRFDGGWVYWKTPPTGLSAGSTYIFTAFLTTAFDQKVNTGTNADADAGYSGGIGYSGEVASGVLTSWSAWYEHDWDFLFRVQEHNPACNEAEATR
jgi:hypothetical protein